MSESTAVRPVSIITFNQGDDTVAFDAERFISAKQNGPGVIVDLADGAEVVIKGQTVGSVVTAVGGYQAAYAAWEAAQE